MYIKERALFLVLFWLGLFAENLFSFLSFRNYAGVLQGLVMLLYYRQMRKPLRQKIYPLLEF